MACDKGHYLSTPSRLISLYEGHLGETDFLDSCWLLITVAFVDDLDSVQEDGAAEPNLPTIHMIPRVMKSTGSELYCFLLFPAPVE